ncbi:hypothetical protein HJG60_007745 [Phyllostomus discolor]|uniref:Uncharacterized protein n=1 Tax=Phyllostomus discolor TaxID=89673 RepID=A0A834BCZ5_9CHIR|nr:hypothetical protein HJG60_007745 [Phyllostomus discolor]
MRHHHAPARMTTIDTSTNSKSWQDAEKGDPAHRWGDQRPVQQLRTAVRSSLNQWNMELPHDPVVPHLGLYLKNPETLIRKNTCTFMLTAALPTIAKTWKQPACPPADKQMQRLWHIYALECR